MAWYELDTGTPLTETTSIEATPIGLLLSLTNVTEITVQTGGDVTFWYQNAPVDWQASNG